MNLNELHVKFNSTHRPKIITLCGSTRFTYYFQTQTYELSMRGYIVCGPAMDKKIDDLFALTDDEKRHIDELHLRKIDMSDAIMVLNHEGYVGKSVEDEIVYALGREECEIRWLEPFVSVLIDKNDPSLGRRNISTASYIQRLVEEHNVVPLRKVEDHG
jgi:hypothetical protein